MRNWKTLVVFTSEIGMAAPIGAKIGERQGTACVPDDKLFLEAGMNNAVFLELRHSYKDFLYIASSHALPNTSVDQVK